MSLLPFYELSNDHEFRLGVSWKCFLEPNGSVMFHSFMNYGKVKGRGAIALREVCQLADSIGVVLVLWTVVPKLFPYYESFGFQMIENRESEVCFYREPRRK